MEKNMIGKYLRALRRRRGMSQQELALALGVSKQTISNWEVGRKVVDLTDRDVRLTYLGQQVPREYIDIIEKLMRCDIAERDAQ
ncbi:MAG: helix-turn-helix transcriptional regulator [Lactobacillus delbrueckii]|nr:helix-turn-helix domain-containing protein [Lactobacillus delbrueckii]MDY5603662.1 helix-turn-helix transcriptional regulator [Lactobacillus delbrueckii]